MSPDRDETLDHPLLHACKGCWEVTRCVGELEDLRKMMESMKRIVTGQGLEEKGGEIGDRMAGLDEAEEKCEGVMPPYSSSTEGNRNIKETVGRI